MQNSTEFQGEIIGLNQQGLLLIKDENGIEQELSILDEGQLLHKNTRYLEDKNRAIFTKV